MTDEDYQELLQLRKEKEIWRKICNYEKNKWDRLMKSLKGSTYDISPKTREHLKNIDELMKEINK